MRLGKQQHRLRLHIASGLAGPPFTLCWRKLGSGPRPRRVAFRCMFLFSVDVAKAVQLLGSLLPTFKGLALDVVRDP